MQSHVKFLIVTVLCLCLHFVFCASEPPSAEVSALQSLYSQCGGQGWKRNTGWMSSSSVCTWYGITCSSDQSNVIEIDFLGTLPMVGQTTTPCGYGGPSVTCGDGNGVICSDGLPTELCALSELQYLDLSINDIGGSLPSCFRSLVHLKRLSLPNTGIGGDLPDLGTLTELEVLNLGDMCGVYTDAELAWYPMLGIPLESLIGGPWNTPGLGCRFSHLENGMIRNTFTGSLPSWLKSTNLTFLNFNDCFFSGPLNVEIFPSTLIALLLQGNTLSGQIPSSLRSLNSLKHLNLNSNAFTGPLPPALSELPSLQILDVAKNSLTGIIDPAFCTQISLNALNVHENQLTGTVPVELGNLRQLHLISFNDNKLEGTLPESLGNVQTLQAIMAQSNKLTGRIPGSYANLVNLLWFDVSSNRLEGSLAMAEYWTRNTNMLARGNNFDGPIPRLAASLSTVDLSWNNLQGPLDPILSLTSVQILHLDHNNLTGSIPPSISSLASLATLTLSNNRLTGAIPPALWSIPLFLVDVSNNQLSGSLTIPPQSAALATIDTLILSNNDLSGSLPASLGTAPLTSFVSSNTKFSGSFPASWVNLKKLVELDLSSNKFAGVGIANSLIRFKQLPNLQKVDLSGNALGGTLIYEAFDSVWNWPSLWSLSLAHNNFTTVLPTWAWPAKISVYDLSYNQLSGELFINWNRPLKSLSIAGNTGLRSSTASLPEGLSPTENYVMSADGHFSCPTLSSPSKTLSIDLDPTYYSYSACLCSYGFFGVNGSCHSCFAGSLCPGGNDGGGIIILAGYAPEPSPANVKGVVACPVGQSGLTSCNPDSKTAWECAEGSEDRLCSKCSSGYYRAGVVCVNCPFVAPYFIAAFLVIAAVSYLYYRIFHWKPNASPSLLQIRVIVIYLQTLRVIMRLSEIFSYPGLFESFGPAADASNAYFDFLRCMSATFLSLETQVFMWFFILPALAALGVLPVLACYLWRSHSLPRVWDGYVRSILAISQLLHLPLTLQLMEAFDCQTDTILNRSFLSSNPYFECDGVSYYQMLVLSIAGTVVYGAGIPGVLLFLSWWLRHVKHDLDDPAYLRLARRYESVLLLYRHRWYSSFILCRSFLLSAASYIIGQQSRVTPALIGMILLISILVIVIKRPYKDTTTNYCEAFALAVVSSTLQQGSVRGTKANVGSTVIDYMMFVMNVATVVSLGAVTLYTLLRVDQVHRRVAKRTSSFARSVRRLTQARPTAVQEVKMMGMRLDAVPQYPYSAVKLQSCARSMLKYSPAVGMPPPSVLRVAPLLSPNNVSEAHLESGAHIVRAWDTHRAQHDADRSTSPTLPARSPPELPATQRRNIEATPLESVAEDHILDALSDDSLRLD